MVKSSPYTIKVKHQYPDRNQHVVILGLNAMNALVWLMLERGFIIRMKYESDKWIVTASEGDQDIEQAEGLYLDDVIIGLECEFRDRWPMKREY